MKRLKSYKVKKASVVVPVFNEEACLEEMISRCLETCKGMGKKFEIILVDGGTFYGKVYQDVQHRAPSIRNAKKVLDWIPSITLDQSIEQTLDFFLSQAIESNEFSFKDTDSQS